ncbi:hypothetical protein KQ51_00087 [Candidatus Izimaplasma bacterium HR1]|nr:hypothetical protein KQ51_00087 [Candidatus Izimaplasma bacterium HR1]
MKKAIKLFLFGFVMLGLVIGISGQRSVEAEWCELPPQGEPIPTSCTNLP